MLPELAELLPQHRRAGQLAAVGEPDPVGHPGRGRARGDPLDEVLDRAHLVRVPPPLAAQELGRGGRVVAPVVADEGGVGHPGDPGDQRLDLPFLARRQLGGKTRRGADHQQQEADPAGPVQDAADAGHAAASSSAVVRTCA